MHSHRNNPLKEKYPWLFLDKILSIDVIYDAGDPGETNERELSAGNDTANAARDICEALRSLGHTVSLTQITETNIEETLKALHGDIVFNNVEQDELGHHTLLSLEKLNKPVTGVDSKGYEISWDKTKIKQMLLEAGVPTPPYFVANPDTDIRDDLTYPLFVKAADDHGSLSITAHSVVWNKEELVKQTAWVYEHIGGDSLVETYIDGRELGVTVLGNGSEQIVLPVREILFGREFDDRPKVFTYDAKWAAGTPDYIGTEETRCPAELTDEEVKTIERVAKKAAGAVKLRDYARFDIRFRDGTPYIIDYNANPALGMEHEASSTPAKVFGLSYEEFLAAIVAVSLKRYKAL